MNGSVLSPMAHSSQARTEHAASDGAAGQRCSTGGGYPGGEGRARYRARASIARARYRARASIARASIMEPEYQ